MQLPKIVVTKAVKILVSKRLLQEVKDQENHRLLTYHHDLCMHV